MQRGEGDSMRRVFIMRKDLNMSPGKLAAQVGHCAEAYWTTYIRKHSAGDRKGQSLIIFTIPTEVYDEYVCGTFTKTICEAKNKSNLLKAKGMAEKMGLKEGIDFGLIYDKCLTELEPEEEDGTTLTGIWFAPLPDIQAQAISKKYQLYK